MCCTLRYLFHSLDAKQTLATGWISLNSSHQQRIQCYLFCFHLSLPIDFTFGRKLSVWNLYYWNVTSHSMIGSIVFSFTHEISTFLEIFFFFRQFKSIIYFEKMHENFRNPIRWSWRLNMVRYWHFLRANIESIKLLIELMFIELTEMFALICNKDRTKTCQKLAFNKCHLTKDVKLERAITIGFAIIDISIDVKPKAKKKPRNISLRLELLSNSHISHRTGSWMWSL